MDIINVNIRYLRKQKGITQQEFADLLKIKRATLGAYEEGRAKPNLDVQRALAKMFDLSLDQLLSRNLSKIAAKNLFKEEAGTNDAEGRKLRVLTITVDEQNREFVELVPAKAAAGYLNGYADPEYIEELPRFRLPLLSEGTYRAFEISGDSMLPLQPGSVVVGEYVQDWTGIKDGLTYVVVSRNDGIVYKRLFNQLPETQKLLLRSDNPSYSPYEIPLEDVVEVWKAKLFISHAPAEQDMSIERMMGMMLELQREVMQLKGKA